MKHTQLTRIIPSSYAEGDEPRPRVPLPEFARVKGGNWNMQGIRRSGLVHDDDECRMSIAEFMHERERRDSGD